MKKLMLAIAMMLSVTAVNAQEDYTPQLTQLASQVSGFVVGTPDSSFTTCEYTNGCLTFTVGAESQLNTSFYSVEDPEVRNQMLQATMAKMLSGNYDQGIMVLDFLAGTRTAICFRMPMPGDANGAMSEVTIWPSDVKPALRKATGRE